MHVIGMSDCSLQTSQQKGKSHQRKNEVKMAFQPTIIFQSFLETCMLYTTQCNSTLKPTEGFFFFPI